MVNNQKSLSEVFKELETVKNKQFKQYKIEEKERKKDSFFYHVKSRTKRDNIILVLITLIFLFTFSLFSRNYIFAVSVDDENKSIVGTFEKNNNPKDVYAIISENISNTEQKEIFDKEEDIEFEIKYNYNKDIPEGEEKVIQEGISGKKIVTYVVSYENNNEKQKEIINEKITYNPQTKIIEVGTSRVLKQYGIHIGDNLYVAENIDLKDDIKENANNLINIPKYYDVKTIEVVEESYLKVIYDNEKIGYISTQYLTSELLTPGIKELCVKYKILNKVQFDMKLNEPSGLSLEDYKKILSNQTQDLNNVFKNNYKAFYDAEQKYGINGVFLASIAIHESGWGNSTIAKDKFNLFGFGAYDSSPYESAVTFENYKQGIDKVAGWLASNYLNVTGTVLKTGEIASGLYYNEATVSGVNVRYATDEMWGTKIFNTMQKLYSLL